MRRDLDGETAHLLNVMSSSPGDLPWDSLLSALDSVDFDITYRCTRHAPASSGHEQAADRNMKATKIVLCILLQLGLEGPASCA